MALDKGSKIVYEEKDKAYIDKLHADIVSLKKEAEAIKDQISESKDRLEGVKSQYAFDIASAQQKLLDLSSEISDKKSKVSDVEKDLSTVSDKSASDIKDLNAKKTDIERDILARTNSYKKLIEDRKKDIEDLVVQSDAMKISIDLLLKDRNVIREDLAGLQDKKTALLSIVDGLSVDARELDNAIGEARTLLDAKRLDLENVSKNYVALRTDCAELKKELESLSVEKEKIIADRDENTRRAKELQEMLDDVRVEKVALANKNASLLKREAALKDAQTKIGG